MKRKKEKGKRKKEKGEKRKENKREKNNYLCCCIDGWWIVS